MADKFLDAKGLKCPAPIIKLSKYMKTDVNLGDQLKMEATDRACRTDVEAWCEKMGQNLIRWEENGDVITMFIEKSREMDQDHGNHSDRNP